jgi:hypothetical protein
VSIKKTSGGNLCKVCINGMLFVSALTNELSLSYLSLKRNYSCIIVLYAVFADHAKYKHFSKIYVLGFELKIIYI